MIWWVPVPAFEGSNSPAEFTPLPDQIPPLILFVSCVGLSVRHKLSGPLIANAGGVSIVKVVD